MRLRPTDVIAIPFENQTYLEGETMICQFSTGEHFVDPTKSYVSVEVELESNDVTTITLPTSETGEIISNGASANGPIPAGTYTLQGLMDAATNQFSSLVTFSYSKLEGKVQATLVSYNTNAQLATTSGNTFFSRLGLPVGQSLNLGTRAGTVTTFPEVPQVSPFFLANWGWCSCANLFRRILLNHKSGTSITNTQD